MTEGAGIPSTSMMKSSEITHYGVIGKMSESIVGTSESKPT